MPPPRRSYATPEETFGITRKPLNDWLDFAASGLPRQGQAFSTELEDANIRNQQRELQSMQLQRDLASEEAASNFLSQAAGKNPQGLMRMLADSPEILGSRDAPMIQDYVSQRQQMQQDRQARQPLSNKTLGPAIAKSITDPMERMRFQQLQDEGMEASDAWQSIQQERKTLAAEQELSKFEEDAASSGVPLDTIRAARSLPPSERRLALSYAKSEAKAGGKGGDDMMIEEYDKVSTMLSKGLGDYGTPEAPENPALYKAASFLMEELNAKMEQRRARNAAANTSTGAVVPQGDFDAAAATAAATPKVTDAVTPAAPPPAPTRKPLGAFEAAKAKTEAEKVATAEAEKAAKDEGWTGIKDALTKEFSNSDPQEFLNLAKAAVAGEEVASDAANLMADFARAYAEGRKVQVGTSLAGSQKEGQYEVPVMVSPEEALLKEFGIEPDEIVGEIPTKFRGVTQKITALNAMRARLDELATPLKQAQATAKAEAKAAAQMTPEAMSSYEKLKAQAQGLTPTQP